MMTESDDIIGLEDSTEGHLLCISWFVRIQAGMMVALVKQPKASALRTRRTVQTSFSQQVGDLVAHRKLTGECRILKTASLSRSAD
jgi:hypothetical protein